MLSCIEDNEARLKGRVKEAPVFSHEVHGEVFYKFFVSAERLSKTEDTIIVTASQSLIENIDIKKGKALCIMGQFRSYNNYSGVGNKLMLTLFAREIYEEEDCFEPENEVYLNGYICKEPVYRVTPFGREIADVLIAVNRAYNKSDYIPAIAWGRNARMIKNACVGSNIIVKGRMQSREYQKKLSETESETKTAYEISINSLEITE